MVSSVTHTWRESLGRWDLLGVGGRWEFGWRMKSTGAPFEPLSNRLQALISLPSRVGPTLGGFRPPFTKLGPGNQRAGI